MTDSQQTEIRTGDAIKIPGDYQYKAITEGFTIQRFWHHEKINVINARCIFTEKDRVLDVGCGSGVICDYLAPKVKTVIGADGNESAIEFARQQYTHENLEFKLGLVEELNFEPETFSWIINMEVLEHLYLEQGKALLNKFYELLQPGGSIFLTTPNYRGLWPLVEWVADRSNKVANMEDDQHVTHYHKKLLTNFVSEVGLTDIQCGTFSTFAPFSSKISWSLAEKISNFERRVQLPFGNLLWLTAQKPIKV